MKFLSTIVQHSQQAARKPKSQGITINTTRTPGFKPVDNSLSPIDNQADSHTQAAKNKPLFENNTVGEPTENTESNYKDLTVSADRSINHNIKQTVQQSDKPKQFKAETSPQTVSTAYSIDHNLEQSIKQSDKPYTESIAKQIQDETSPQTASADHSINSNIKQTIQQSDEPHTETLNKSKQFKSEAQPQKILANQNKVNVGETFIQNTGNHQITKSNATNTTEPVQVRKKHQTTNKKDKETIKAGDKQQIINSHHTQSGSVIGNKPQRDTVKSKKQILDSRYINRPGPSKAPQPKITPKTVQQTPQVRIGQINVLIEDTAKTVAKPAPTTKTSSPFGLRGL